MQPSRGPGPHSTPMITTLIQAMRGQAQAFVDDVTITLTGTGGHGAMPHRAADPVVAAASVVMALQTVVPRNVDPQQTAIVTVGALNAGRANNVIAQTATLERVLLAKRFLAHPTRPRA